MFRIRDESGKIPSSLNVVEVGKIERERFLNNGLNEEPTIKEYLFRLGLNFHS